MLNVDIHKASGLLSLARSQPWNDGVAAASGGISEI
jgi:hypothetical protein